MEFKDRIKSLRKEAHMTTTALAAELNKSDTAIRMWETGKSKPDADTLIRLSLLFHCSIDYLLGCSDFKNKESWQVLEDTESAIQKGLLNFSGREKFLDSLSHLLESLGEMSDSTKRNTAISLISDVLHDCGELASKSNELQLSPVVKTDTYIAFRDVYEICVNNLLVYRDILTHAASTANKKSTPFGEWLESIKDQ